MWQSAIDLLLLSSVDIAGQSAIGVNIDVVFIASGQSPIDFNIDAIFSR